MVSCVTSTLPAVGKNISSSSSSSASCDHSDGERKKCHSHSELDVSHTLMEAICTLPLPMHGQRSPPCCLALAGNTSPPAAALMNGSAPVSASGGGGSLCNGDLASTHIHTLRCKIYLTTCLSLADLVRESSWYAHHHHHHHHHHQLADELVMYTTPAPTATATAAAAAAIGKFGLDTSTEGYLNARYNGKRPRPRQPGCSATRATECSDVFMFAFCYLRSLFINSRYEFLAWSGRTRAATRLTQLSACSVAPEALIYFVLIYFSLYTHTHTHIF